MADATEPAIGHVIVARADGRALIIWDASPEVGAIVTQRLSDGEAQARLNGDIIAVLGDSLSKVSSGARTLTLRVVYNRTGAVSPVYGAATFSGVERIEDVTADVKDLRADRENWRGHPGPTLPSWFVVNETGKLPPR